MFSGREAMGHNRGCYHPESLDGISHLSVAGEQESSGFQPCLGGFPGSRKLSGGPVHRTGSWGGGEMQIGARRVKQ